MPTFDNPLKRIAILPLMAALLTLIAGCAHLPWIGKPQSAGYRLGVSPFEDHTPYGDWHLGAALRSGLIDNLRLESARHLDIVPLDAGQRLPESLLAAQPAQNPAAFDNLSLARAGRRLGLNAVLTGGILDISLDHEDRGWFWFHTTRSVTRIIVRVAVYDTYTGAMLFDENQVREIDMPDVDTLADPAGIDRQEVGEVLDQIAEDLADAIADALADEPWTGFIVDRDQDRVTFTAARGVGLKPGAKLDVFSTGRILDGTRAQRFAVPNVKVGTLRVTDVDQGRGQGVILSDNGVKIDCAVRLE